MKRFQNLLVLHTDRVGDERTLRRATELARVNGALLTIARTIDDSNRPDVAADPHTREQWLEQQRFSLERLGASVRHEGVHAATRVLDGDPVEETVKTVVQNGHDLLLMTAEGNHGLRRRLFGSMSMQLMRKCPCPVWLTKGRPGSYAGIMVAVDLASSDEPRSALNRTLLEIGASLAKREGSVLHVVHAWDFNESEGEASRAEVTLDLVNLLIRKNEKEHRERIDRLMEGIDLTGVATEIHIEQGQPDWALPRIARDERIELMVMGTAARSGMQGLIVGNTAEAVLPDLDCAVMAVKPREVVTPILSAHQPKLERGTSRRAAGV